MKWKRQVKRVSKREHLLAVKGQLDGLSILAGKTPETFMTRIPDAPKPRAPRDPLKITEASVSQSIREWCKSAKNLVLWRNTRGSVELEGGGRIMYGLGPNGSADLIGFRSIEITQAMVGQRVAVFAAIEVKRPDGRLRADQQQFLDRIIDAGGIAGCADSGLAAETIIYGWRDGI